MARNRQTKSEQRVGTWSHEANHRLKNRKWLRYSSNIARRVLSALEDNRSMSQKQLAEVVAVSPQYINKVCKGQQNLTLETIGKLSDALGVELISFPSYKYSFVQPYSIDLNPQSVTANIQMVIVHSHGNRSASEIDLSNTSSSVETSPHFQGSPLAV